MTSFQKVLLFAQNVHLYLSSKFNYIFAKLHKNIWVDRNVLVYKSQLAPGKKSINVGFGCKLIESQLHGNICLDNGVTVQGVLLRGNVEIGSYTSIMGPNTIISAGISEISIGKYCSIARRVSILATSHCSDRLMTATVGKRLLGKKLKGTSCSRGPVRIGHDVWLGVNAVVLDGISIGNGAVIGANAVVTKNVPDYAIVAGVPAKVIKYRFDEKIISRLQELKIWNFPESALINRLENFEKPLDESVLGRLELLKKKGFSEL